MISRFVAIFIFLGSFYILGFAPIDSKSFTHTCDQETLGLACDANATGEESEEFSPDLDVLSECLSMETGLRTTGFVSADRFSCSKIYHPTQERPPKA